MIEKKLYAEPELKLIRFSTDDIITASTDDTDPYLEDDFE